MKPIRSGHVSAFGDERGSTIVFVSLAMAALLSIVALAVDIGMLYTARGEAQRAADASALAGAAAGFLDAAPPGSAQDARNEAVRIGGNNMIQGQPVVIDPDADVDVDMANQRVTVTVRRTGARGNPIVTWFANVFGVGQADVAALAAAQVELATGAVCVKPFAVPDAWADFGGLGGPCKGCEEPTYEPNEGDYYVAEETGYGSHYRDGKRNGIDIPPNTIDPLGTTYDQDFGRPMVIKPGNPGDAAIASWYFPWDVPQGGGSGGATGGARYRWNIANCNTSLIEVGKPYNVENGNMKGPTRQGIADLIALDPNAIWDASQKKVVNSAYEPWKASPRVVTLPLYDPTSPLDPGKKPIVFNNLTSFFIDRMQSDNVIGRFLFASGIIVPGNGPGPGGPGFGNQARAVHLVR